MVKYTSSENKVLNICENTPNSTHHSTPFIHSHILYNLSETSESEK